MEKTKNELLRLCDIKLKELESLQKNNKAVTNGALLKEVRDVRCMVQDLLNYTISNLPDTRDAIRLQLIDDCERATVSLWELERAIRSTLNTSKQRGKHS